MNIDVINRALAWAQEQGMNQSAFAARLGVLPQHITNWKKRGVPADQYQPMADVLGRSVDELLGRKSGGAAAISISSGGMQRWPSMPSVDEEKVRRLSDVDRARLEVAILAAAGAIGLDIKKDE